MLVIAADGEAVAWHSVEDSDRLKLRGAYIAVTIGSCITSAKEFAVGSIEHLYIGYEGASFLAHQIGGGYFVVLELDSSANVGEALHRMKPFAEELRIELDA